MSKDSEKPKKRFKLFNYIQKSFEDSLRRNGVGSKNAKEIDERRNVVDAAMAEIARQKASPDGIKPGLELKTNLESKSFDPLESLRKAFNDSLKRNGVGAKNAKNLNQARINTEAATRAAATNGRPKPPPSAKNAKVAKQAQDYAAAYTESVKSGEAEVSAKDTASTKDSSSMFSRLKQGVKSLESFDPVKSAGKAFDNSLKRNGVGSKNAKNLNQARIDTETAATNGRPKPPPSAKNAKVAKQAQDYATAYTESVKSGEAEVSAKDTASTKDSSSMFSRLKQGVKSLESFDPVKSAGKAFDNSLKRNGVGSKNAKNLNQARIDTESAARAAASPSSEQPKLTKVEAKRAAINNETQKLAQAYSSEVGKAPKSETVTQQQTPPTPSAKSSISSRSSSVPTNNFESKDRTASMDSLARTVQQMGDNALDLSTQTSRKADSRRSSLSSSASADIKTPGPALPGNLDSALEQLKASQSPYQIDTTVGDGVPLAEPQRETRRRSASSSTASLAHQALSDVAGQNSPTSPKPEQSDSKVSASPSQESIITHKLAEQAKEIGQAAVQATLTSAPPPLPPRPYSQKLNEMSAKIASDVTGKINEVGIVMQPAESASLNNKLSEALKNSDNKVLVSDAGFSQSLFEKLQSFKLADGDFSVKVINQAVEAAIASTKEAQAQQTADAKPAVPEKAVKPLNDKNLETIARNIVTKCQKIDGPISEHLKQEDNAKNLTAELTELLKTSNPKFKADLDTGKFMEAVIKSVTESVTNNKFQALTIATHNNVGEALKETLEQAVKLAPKTGLIKTTGPEVPKRPKSIRDTLSGNSSTTVNATATPVQAPGASKGVGRT